MEELWKGNYKRKEEIQDHRRNSIIKVNPMKKRGRGKIKRSVKEERKMTSSTKG